MENDWILFAVRDVIRRENVPVATIFLNFGFTVSHDNLLPEYISHSAGLKSSECSTGMLLDTLLRSGEVINARGQYQRTCIWNAITDYHDDQLSVLLQRGADPCLRDVTGSSSLKFVAARAPHLIVYVKCVQILLGWFDLHWAELSTEERLP